MLRFLEKPVDGNTQHLDRLLHPTVSGVQQQDINLMLPSLLRRSGKGNKGARMFAAAVQILQEAPNAQIKEWYRHQFGEAFKDTLPEG